MIIEYVKRCWLKDNLKKDIITFFTSVEKESSKSGLGEIRPSFVNFGDGWHVYTDRFEKNLSRSRKRVNALIEIVAREAFKNDDISCQKMDENDRYKCTGIEIPSIEPKMDVTISVGLDFQMEKNLGMWMYDPKRAREISGKEALLVVVMKSRDLSIVQNETEKMDEFLESICKAFR